MSESAKEDTCLVCHEDIKYFAVGKCEHAVCFRCSTRMRVLCAQNYCAICRTDLPKVHFATNLIAACQKNSQFKIINHKHNIYFEDADIQREFFKLLEHSCNWCEKKPLRTFLGLKDHVRKEHNLHYCDLCVNHLKIFSSERKAYDRKKLAEHRRQGDEDDKSHKGHPLCRFCDERYLDNDELVKHLRKDHYYCHFCEADGICNEFFGEYPVLRDHFLEAHFLCEEDECATSQFTNAFRTDIDLKAHKAQAHSRGMRKSIAKQVRTLDIDFSISSRTGAASGGRGRGRGRYQREAGENNSGGVVSRDDFEEVHSSETRRKGSNYNNQRKAERNQERQELETAQAISASLNEIQSRGHVNVIDRNMLESTSGFPNSRQSQPQNGGKKTLDEPERFEGRGEDFPTLDGHLRGQSRPVSGDEPQNKADASRPSKETLAKTLALANNFSVQEGSLAQEDFPSLGGPRAPAPSNPVSSAKAAKPLRVWQQKDEDFPSLSRPVGKTKAPVNKPAKWVSTPKSNNVKPVVSKPSYQSAADFPSLSSISGSLFPSQTTSRPSSSHSNPPTSKEVKQSKPRAALYDDLILDEPISRAAEPAKIQMVTHKSSDTRASSIKPYHQSVTMEDDFPSLKPSKPASTRKKDKAAGQQSKASKSVPTPPSHVSSPSPSDQDSEFVKPKKTAKHEIKETKDNEQTMKSKSKSKRKKKAKSNSNVEEKSDEENETPFNYFKKGDLSSFEKDLNSKPLEEQNTTKSTVEENLQNMSLSTESQSSVNAVPTLKLDDFPSLMSSMQVPSKGPPPGFSTDVSVPSKAPPPGFNMQGGEPAIKSLHMTSSAPPPGFKTPDSDAPPTVPSESKLLSSDYMPPANFQERNQKLIADIKKLLSSSKFEDFCKCSREFRQGTLPALKYYETCRDLLGEKEFPHIFSELLVLLPDVEKQADLLKAHNSAQKASKHWSKNKKKWNFPDMTFSSCNTCSQILHTATDFNAHMQTHCLDTEFPELGAPH